MRLVTPALFAATLVLSIATALQAQPLDRGPLEGYIATAIKQNPDLGAARARWDQASARVGQAASNLWPHIDVAMQYMDYSGGRYIQIAPNQPAVPVSSFGVVPWDNKIEAVWPIFNYSIWQASKATKAYLAASTDDVSSHELAIAYAVSEAYYAYAKSSELVAIRESAVKLAGENLSTAQALFRAEKAQKNDVLRADVAVATAQGDVLEARNMQNLAKTNFNNLLHRDYDADIELPSMAMNEQGASQELASLDSTTNLSQLPSFGHDLEEALRSRPEIDQITNSAEAIEGVKRVSASDYFPNLALFATYGFQEAKLQFDTKQDYLASGIQLRWNLFQGFNTNAKVEENNAQLEELSFQKEGLVSGIRLELQNARLEVENTRERHVVAIKQLQSAEENHRITKAQYDAGTVPLITMIDAETTLSNARANLTVTTFDELTAEAKYRKALGHR